MDDRGVVGVDDFGGYESMQVRIGRGVRELARAARAAISAARAEEQVDHAPVRAEDGHAPGTAAAPGGTGSVRDYRTLYVPSILVGAASNRPTQSAERPSSSGSPTTGSCGSCRAAAARPNVRTGAARATRAA